MNVKVDQNLTKEYVVSKVVPAHAVEPNLRDGRMYRESLRDGRVVIVDGKEVGDVTQVPTLARGIDTVASYYDAQFDPATRDEVTSIDPATGERFSTAWLIPRTKEDLYAHERAIRLTTSQTFGVFGRPPDYGATKAISFVAWNHLISKGDKDALAKVENFIKVGRRNNLMSADIVADIQANRKLAPEEMKGRLRVVEERKDGVILHGAKAAASNLAQGNIGTISMPPPSQNPPEDSRIWAALPANAPGLRYLQREQLTTGFENIDDHPIDSLGEESDCVLIFDNVFVPWEYVFSYKNAATVNSYTTLGQFAFWKIANRLSYRAEIFAGAAQMIVDALGTDHIPAVRQMVAEVVQYSAILRGMMQAAVENCAPTESGVMLPNHGYVTAGRLFSIEHYPRIMQTLRDLSGQGLIGRVPRETWERADVKGMLDEYLPGYRMDAWTKNKLFNLIWDMTCSPHAMRVALFENINATPAPALREELYRSYDRSPGLRIVKKRLGID
ncbi:MAG: 4-hydroxyphenylacetate 3-hydroxylase N-terminal domain-containing protein [Tetrasphaera sp.]